MEKQLMQIKLENLIEKITRDRGVNLAIYKSSFLQRRLDIRLRARGIKDYLQYGFLLDEDPSEYNALFDALSINVTEFFRDKDVFDAFLNEIIPKILATKKNVSLTVWCAGCATGEEAYSIAIQIKEALKGSEESSFRVIGTDVNSKSIAVAKRGKYRESSLKNLPKHLLVKYFHNLSDSEFYEIDNEIKSHVSFNKGDLTTYVSPRFLDVIFCRNVLMYLDREVQYDVFAKFYHSLMDSGFLVLGTAESIIGRPSELFECVLPKERVYHKR